MNPESNIFSSMIMMREHFPPHQPENILCVKRNSHHIKLIDFGLARRFYPSETCRVLFGTPEFIAPEIINYEPISYATDMWAVGVVCYVL